MPRKKKVEEEVKEVKETPKPKKVEKKPILEVLAEVKQRLESACPKTACAHDAVRAVNKAVRHVTSNAILREV
jgi:hypothetical protein